MLSREKLSEYQYVGTQRRCLFCGFQTNQTSTRVVV